MHATETNLRDTKPSAESAGRAPIVNYFDTPDAAERYADARPRHHSRALELMRKVLANHVPVARALDVGCGTGHSTTALLPFAGEIAGVDASSVMLARAPSHPRISYRKGYAEALPFRAAQFDLVTVSSAYHWFDPDRFLGEAARVLRAPGWLVLYKVGATGRMPDNPEFERWRREVLKAFYPEVARNCERLTPERAAQFGFVEVMCEEMRHPQRHALDDYVENLLTHSSVIRVIEGSAESVDATRAWFRRELAPFFPGGEAEFVHEAWIHVWQRQPGA
jgi:ubiquinone/menaquinone biosynthesis C-methylase UbiE